MKQLTDEVRDAMRMAFNLGQTYWRQADSESAKQQNKSDATREQFKALMKETVSALDTAQPVQVNAMLLTAAMDLRRALSNVLQRIPSDEWPKWLAVRHEADKIITAAKQAQPEPVQQAQPERAPLSADAYEALVDDLGEWSLYVVEDTAHITLDTHIRRTLAVHGIKQGGQHD